MKKIDDLSVVFLVCSGRAGSGLLHSLLDSHKEVLTLPMELSFYRMWERLGCDGIDNVDEMVERWCYQTRLKKLKIGIHYGYEEGKNCYSNCDFKKFQDQFRALLKEKGLSRINTFLAIHQAYADSIAQNLDQVKVILEFSAIHIKVDSALKDFPEAYFLNIVRDPRANYASIKQHYLNTRRSLLDLKAKQWNLKFVPVFIVKKLSLGMAILLECQERVGQGKFFTVRLEDLHASLESTMKKVSQWLQIEFTPSLLESTLGGRLWKGNSAFGKPVQGVSSEVVDRWKKTLGKLDVLFVEYNFKEYMKKNGYAFRYSYEHSKKLILWRVLFPFREEFKFCLFKNTFSCFISEILKFFIRILFYPISRFYLLKLIMKKL